MPSLPAPSLPTAQTGCRSGLPLFPPRAQQQTRSLGEHGLPVASLAARFHGQSRPAVTDENYTLPPMWTGGPGFQATPTPAGSIKHPSLTLGAVKAHVYPSWGLPSAGRESPGGREPLASPFPSEGTCSFNGLSPVFSSTSAFQPASPSTEPHDSPDSCLTGGSTWSDLLRSHPCSPPSSTSRHPSGTRPPPTCAQPTKGEGDAETAAKKKQEGLVPKSTVADGNRPRHPSPSTSTAERLHEMRKAKRRARQKARPPKSRDQRARDRKSATKCRLKTEAAAKQLVVTEQDARGSYDDLVTEEKKLLDQVYVLKRELVMHAHCCPLIRRYLALSAEQISDAAERNARGLKSTKRMSAAAIVMADHREQQPS